MSGLLVPEGLTDIKPIREIIYQHLKQVILDGLVKPGDRLVERSIAEKFNASRTPVREALRKLESEGYIEYVARKGVVVRGFNIEEIEEIYNIRKALECLAIRRAIKNISEAQIEELKGIVEQLQQAGNSDEIQSTYQGLHAFDDLIITTVNMPILKGFLQTMKEALARYRKINLSNHPRRKDAVKEHKDILEAIVQRDVERAELLVCLHIENSRNEVMRLIKSRQN